MKNILTGSGILAIALCVTLSSCVSKKKYTEAQAAIEKYRADSAVYAAKSVTMQQNLSSLEKNNRTIKSQSDSSRNRASRYQKRWDEFQSYYDQRTKSAEELRNQANSALSGTGLSEENVQVSNGWVIIKLPKELLFISGANLSKKGKAALVKIATLVESNDDYSVDVATSDSYAAFARHMDKKGNRMKGHKSDENMSDSTMSDTAMIKSKRKLDRKMSDTTMNNDDSGQVKDTARAQQKMVKKQKTLKKTEVSGTTDQATTAKRNGGAENWGMDLSRATAIVKILAQNGAAEVRLIAPVYSQTRNTVTTDPTAEEGFYVMLSPKMHKMDEMMKGGQDGK